MCFTYRKHMRQKARNIAHNLRIAWITHPAQRLPAADSISCIAVVGAMTDILIRTTADLGVQLYITGQYRQPARAAVRETNMTVVIVGHTQREQWGLRALAGLLCERWATLEVIIAPHLLP